MNDLQNALCDEHEHPVVFELILKTACSDCDRLLDQTLLSIQVIPRALFRNLSYDQLVVLFTAQVASLLKKFSDENALMLQKLHDL